MRDGELAARTRDGAAEASFGSAIGSPDRSGIAGATPPGSSRGEIDEAFQRVADQLEERLDHLTAAGLGAMRAGLPAWLQPDGGGWEQLELHLRASLHAALTSFRAGVLPGGMPAADAALLEVAEEIGDLDALLAGYGFAQASLWGAWFELVGRASAGSRAKRELLARGSRFFLRYSELASRYIAAEYRRRIDRRTGLWSAPNGGPAADAELGPFAGAPEFDLRQHHLAALVWGGAAVEAARELAGGLDRACRIRSRGPTAWVCLSGREQLSRRQWRALRAFEPRARARVAVGLEGYGEAGLRLSFRQAQQARSLAEDGAAVTHYADVAVEALALRPEAEARSFVRHELCGIDDDSAASERLRETLRAYIAADLNAASAAAALGVHHQTVANRLRTIEERLGRPLVSRTLELALALRLRQRVSE